MAPTGASAVLENYSLRSAFARRSWRMLSITFSQKQVRRGIPSQIPTTDAEDIFARREVLILDLLPVSVSHNAQQLWRGCTSLFTGADAHHFRNSARKINVDLR